jgi:hypothetical protein
VGYGTSQMTKINGIPGPTFNTLSWKDHINHLVVKLSAASYSIRTLSAVMTQDSLRMIYFAYIHSIISYGIIFWGNSIHSNLIFKTQKRVVRIIMKACPLFRKLKILPLYSQYIYSVLIFVAKNMDIYKFNSSIHSISTRQVSHLHFSTNKSAKVQKGVYYSGIRIYNKLPHSIRNLSNDIIKFKQALKRFLLTGSFYSLTF